MQLPLYQVDAFTTEVFRGNPAAVCPLAAWLPDSTMQAIAIATAPADPALSPGADFVSRFFAPGASIAEDPVTGSAHCTLVPYWADRLGKATLEARQVPRRGGALRCGLDGDRVRMTGHAVCYLEGTITVPPTT